MYKNELKSDTVLSHFTYTVNLEEVRVWMLPQELAGPPLQEQVRSKNICFVCKPEAINCQMRRVLNSLNEDINNWLVIQA